MQESIGITSAQFRRILETLSPEAHQRVAMAMAETLTAEEMTTIISEEGRLSCCTTPSGAHESGCLQDFCNCECHGE